MSRKTLAALALALLGSSAIAQVAPPKYESRFHHIFHRHRDADNLEQRFNDVKCALLLIEAGPKLGTGFYISPDGDVATASHVISERTFTLVDGKINVSMSVPLTIQLTNSAGEKIEVAANTIERNPDAWVADVALLKTGRKTSCWLQTADDHKSYPGQPLITMGFPGLSFQALTIYSGIMSARLSTNLPTVILATGEAVKTSTEFIRVQMPISTGLSGAPILDDDNRAIAIVTNAGGWTQDLDNLILAFHGGAFKMPPPPQPTTPQPPNTVTFNLNSMAVTAELAALFHDYASPGYGDAVPLRYLKIAQQQNPAPASHAH